MNLILSILSLGIVLNCGLCPSYLTQAQCLSYNDKDVASAPEVDMSGIQDFNIDLFKRLVPKSPTRNFIFSPYSIWNALILAYFGSAGETERQLGGVLRVGDKLSAYKKWRQLEYMYNMRPSTTIDNTFVLSNRAYFDSSVSLKICMEDLLHNELLQLDMMNNPNKAATVINNFVAETTRGHIKQLVSPDDIRFAHLVLVNAAYFKGNWQTTFDPKDTRNRTFENLNGDQFEVPMMSRFGLYNYSYDDVNSFHSVELPYVGEMISMYIFLPYDAGALNFNNMIASLNFGDINKLVDGMYETKMHVHLPKFSLESIVEEELMQALSSMGVKDAFIRGKANFTDFTFNPEVYLDQGIHKAYINVNEEGTEAAAATAFIVNKVGGSSIFSCNKPFVFVIRDKQTKNMLFMGAYKNPDSKKVSPPGEYSIPTKPHAVPSVYQEPTGAPSVYDVPTGAPSVYPVPTGAPSVYDVSTGAPSIYKEPTGAYAGNPEPSSEYAGDEVPSSEFFGIQDSSNAYPGNPDPPSEVFGIQDPSNAYPGNPESSIPNSGTNEASVVPPFNREPSPAYFETHNQKPTGAFFGMHEPSRSYTDNREIPSAYYPGARHGVKG